MSLLIVVMLFGCSTIREASQTVKQDSETADASFKPQGLSKLAPANGGYEVDDYFIDGGSSVSERALVPQLKHWASLNFTNETPFAIVLDNLSRQIGVPIIADRDALSVASARDAGDVGADMPSSQIVPVSNSIAAPGEAKAVLGPTGSQVPLPGLGQNVGRVLGSSPKSEGSGGFTWSMNGSANDVLDYVTRRYDLDWDYDPQLGAVKVFLYQLSMLQVRQLDQPQTEDTTSDSGNSAAATNNSGLTVGSLQSGGSSQSQSSGGSGGQDRMVLTSHQHIDALKDLKDAVDKVLGDGGWSYLLGETSQIEIYATKTGTHLAKQIVNSYNAQARRQVTVAVQLFQITLNKEQDYTANLNPVFETLSKTFKVVAQGAVAPSIANAGSFTGSILSPSNGGGTSSNSAKFGGSQAAFQAFAQNGSTTVFANPTLLLSNGRLSSFQNLVNTPYVVAAQAAQLNSSGSAISNGGLIQSFYTTGYSVSMRALIYGDGRIRLQVKLSSQQLLGNPNFTSAGETVQQPIVQSLGFDQGFTVHDGNTIMVTGFPTRQGISTKEGTGSADLIVPGGENAAQLNRTQIVLLITPYTMDDSAVEEADSQ